jgi:hypothetical protein
MSVIKMSWESETGRLKCRWSEAGKRADYNLRWLQDAANSVGGKNASPLFLDFRRLSPFGGGRSWWVPAHARDNPNS